MNFQEELQAMFTLHGLASLVILSLLELVLGVDNIIFISLVIVKLPEEDRFKARVTALSIAFIMRIVLLLCLVWLSKITTSLFTVSSFHVSIRDILFLIGGSFLTFSTMRELTGHLDSRTKLKDATYIVYKSFILQIVLVDVLFSFDSIFTAIGINPNLIIMAFAVGIGMVFMIYLAGHVSKFIEKNPSIKTLALCFIIGVGLMLITQALHIEILKIYLYGALLVGIIITTISMGLKRNSNK